MKILINSTSFLLPNNQSWSILKNKNKLIFSDYGNINNLEQSKNKIDIEILLLFLPDLIDYLSDEQLNYSSQAKKISNILKLLKQKLKTKNKKVIIGLSEYFYNNIVESSKKIDLSKKIKAYFLDELYKISKKNNNLFIIDLDNMFSENGYKNCFDQRNYYAFRCRLSAFGIEILSKNLNAIVSRINFTNKKVLLLDCDNTIWGGVLAEDGMESLQIGQDGIGSAFLDFQKAIKKIKNNGILIVLVSKNDKSDVENKKFLDTIKNKKIKKKLVILSLKESKPGYPLLLHDEPIYCNKQIVGRTTSGNYSFNFKKNIAFAYIDTSKTVDNTKLEIEIEKKKYKIKLETKPLHDSDNKIMKE